MNKILWTWIMFTAGISCFSLHFQPCGMFLHFLPLGWLLQSIILFSRRPVLPKDSKMCLLHHKDSPLIVCTTVPKIIFYLLLLQRFLSVRGIPTLLDINLHLLRNMIITLNHLSSVCYVLLISKDCSSCSMCRRRQCLLVNSRNLPTVKGTHVWGDTFKISFMMLELMRFCRVGAQVLRRGHNLFKTRSFWSGIFCQLVRKW